MTARPYLGDVREEWQVFICGHAPSPDALHCDRDATWHGFVVDDEAVRIVATMESCDEHLPQLEQASDYVHPLQHPCGIPGSRFRWPENECFIEWDEAEFLAAAMADVPEPVAS